MYYILYEGLQIESNEPVYCIMCTACEYRYKHLYKYWHEL